jgi:hypothetical protein
VLGLRTSLAGRRWRLVAPARRYSVPKVEICFSETLISAYESQHVITQSIDIPGQAVVDYISGSRYNQYEGDLCSGMLRRVVW